MKISKIMIVDDDEDILFIGELSGRTIGKWAVVTTPSASEALAMAEKELPDVILLDVMMPDLDGPSVLARLREQPRSASIPVIFMTARAQRHEIEQYERLGAAGVIRKPFDPTSLPDEIRRIVEAG